MTELDLERYRLSDAEHERIFREVIIPQHLSSLRAQDRPVVVFVGGQPGAGKTATTETVAGRLGARGGLAHVCGDFYKPHHPEYRRLMIADDATAGAYTRLDARAWHAKAEAYARAQRANAVIETALSGPGGFSGPAAAFRAAGYRVEVAALAVPEALSRLGIIARYADQLSHEGRGRMVATDNHDACYRGILDTATQIDVGTLADIVQVFRRGNQLVHANNVTTEGKWASPPRMRGAIQAERGRTWTHDEARAFLGGLARLRTQLGEQWHPTLQEIGQLGEPLLPPGVSATAGVSAAFPARLHRATAPSQGTVPGTKHAQPRGPATPSSSPDLGR